MLGVVYQCVSTSPDPRRQTTEEQSFILLGNTERDYSPAASSLVASCSQLQLLLKLSAAKTKGTSWQEPGSSPQVVVPSASTEAHWTLDYTCLRHLS